VTKYNCPTIAVAKNTESYFLQVLDFHMCSNLQKTIPHTPSNHDSWAIVFRRALAFDIKPLSRANNTNFNNYTH